MKKLSFLILLSLMGYLVSAQEKPNTAYPFDPATQRDSSIKAGEIIERQFSASKIYPGTVRTYWIYVPAGYSPDKPACLYVNMDGIQFNAPVVFDNLIASGEMPVTIGVFVGSGKVVNDDNKTLRYNRSNEFDRTDDTFVGFLLDELLPDAEKQKTSDGRPIRFSKNSNDRAIAGASSGAICAFTAAWQRPDAFSRVFSAIGTYVSMRGGNDYPALIRKTEPKVLRIYLQDGIYDAWNPLFGSWFEANLLMESALNFAGYEVNHLWGRGGHDGKDATGIFPDVMRWLWKGWPAKVQQGTSLNDMLTTILLKDEGWNSLKLPVTATGELFPDKAGNIHFQDEKGEVYKLDPSDKASVKMELRDGDHLIGSGSNELYIASSRGTITAWGPGKNEVVASGMKNAVHLEVTPEKDIYMTRVYDDRESTLWQIKSGGGKHRIHRLRFGGSYFAIYPNHHLLMQTEQHSEWIYSYVINNEGSLMDGQRFYWLHNTDNYSFEENGGMTFDENGNLYVATKMGIQVCDQNGRVRAILTLPSGPVTAVTFGGKDHNILYAISAGKIYRRKLNTKGVSSWMAPIEPASQGAG